MEITHYQKRAAHTLFFGAGQRKIRGNSAGCMARPRHNPGATFSKLLRKILGRFLILGQSY